MRKLTIPIAIVTGLSASSALAADVAVKAPPAAPAPVYSWTGWYAGVNLGASFGNAKTDFNVPVTVAETVTTAGGSASGTSTFGSAGSDTEYPSGFIGGGQIGYNWQFSPLWVAGLEADFQGALERDSNRLTNNFSGTASGTSPTLIFSSSVVGSTVLDYQTKIDWFGTVRGRIGYVWGNGQVLTYVTGGLAYGEVKINGTSAVSGLVSAVPFSIIQAFGHSQVNTGWVAGYGTEGRLGNSNWTWKIEGLYMDLGTLDATGSGVSPLAVAASATAIQTVSATAQVNTHTRFTDGILRGGLNYQFR